MVEFNGLSMSEEEFALFKKIYGLKLLVKKAGKEPGPDSLAEGERGILFQLYLHGEGLYSGELSEKIGVGTGRIGNALKRLETLGLVERSKEKSDRRKVKVTLTGEGYKKMTEVTKKVHERQKKMIQEVGYGRLNAYLDESEALVKVLSRICEEEKKEEEHD